MERVNLVALVAREVAAIRQPDLLALARRLVIEPRVEQRAWDHGEPASDLPCWFVMEDVPSNTGIAYCASGFGPSYPWGLLFLTGKHLSMGMDFSWFASVEDALRNCRAWDGENPPDYEIA